MSTTVDRHKAGVLDYQPIRCGLEMSDDGQIAVIVEPGCSIDDVHDMLRQLALCNGQFDHLTFVDEDGT